MNEIIDALWSWKALIEFSIFVSGMCTIVASSKGGSCSSLEEEEE
jgi:hypothetical protein